MSQEEFEGETTMSLIEQVSTAQFQMAPSYVYEELTAEFRNKAGEMFAVKSDEKARWYRDLSDEVEARAKKHRNSAHKEALDKRSRLFVELEKRIVDEKGQERV